MNELHEELQRVIMNNPIVQRLYQQQRLENQHWETFLMRAVIELDKHNLTLQQLVHSDEDDEE